MESRCWEIVSLINFFSSALGPSAVCSVKAGRVLATALAVLSSEWLVLQPSRVAEAHCEGRAAAAPELPVPFPSGARAVQPAGRLRLLGSHTPLPTPQGVCIKPKDLEGSQQKWG